MFRLPPTVEETAYRIANRFLRDADHLCRIDRDGVHRPIKDDAFHALAAQAAADLAAWYRRGVRDAAREAKARGKKMEREMRQRLRARDTSGYATARAAAAEAYGIADQITALSYDSMLVIDPDMDRRKKSHGRHAKSSPGSVVGQKKAVTTRARRSSRTKP